MRFFNDRFYTYKIQYYKKTNDLLYELAKIYLFQKK